MIYIQLVLCRHSPLLECELHALSGSLGSESHGSFEVLRIITVHTAIVVEQERSALADENLTIVARRHVVYVLYHHLTLRVSVLSSQSLTVGSDALYSGVDYVARLCVVRDIVAQTEVVVAFCQCHRLVESQCSLRCRSVNCSRSHRSLVGGNLIVSLCQRVEFDGSDALLRSLHVHRYGREFLRILVALGSDVDVEDVEILFAHLRNLLCRLCSSRCCHFHWLGEIFAHGSHKTVLRVI